VPDDYSLSVVLALTILISYSATNRGLNFIPVVSLVNSY